MLNNQKIELLQKTVETFKNGVKFDFLKMIRLENGYDLQQNKMMNSKYYSVSKENEVFLSIIHNGKELFLDIRNKEMFDEYTVFIEFKKTNPYEKQKLKF